jgi:hypothetical protein
VLASIDWHARKSERCKIAIECEYALNIQLSREDSARLVNERNSVVVIASELVEYVERERAAVERREERRQAPIWQRWKWYVFGAPDDETAG